MQIRDEGQALATIPPIARRIARVSRWQQRKTGRTGAMQTAKYAGVESRSNDRRDIRPAKADFDIDLERVIYDPAYRNDVRDQLNRSKQRSRERDRNP